MKSKILPPVKKSHWNYRVLAHPHPTKGEKEIYFQVHEVHYKNEIPVSYGETAARIGGDDIKEIQAVIQRVWDTVFYVGSPIPKYKIIWAGERFPEYYEGKK